MADNYLERKMDELRNRRPAKAVARTLPHASKGSIQNAISLYIPGRRALVVGGASGIFATITRGFLNAGCKVAVFDSYDSPGQHMAYSEGVRFHPVDLSEPVSITSAFITLLKAWRDIDIVIFPTQSTTPTRIDSLHDITLLWADHRRRFPIPSDYGFRLININISDIPNTGVADGDTDMADICMSQIHVDPSFLTEPSRLSSLSKTLTDTCLFLSLPSISILTSSIVIS